MAEEFILARKKGLPQIFKFTKEQFNPLHHDRVNPVKEEEIEAKPKKVEKPAKDVKAEKADLFVSRKREGKK